MRTFRGVAALTATSLALSVLLVASPVSGLTATPGASIHLESKNPVVTGDVWTTFGQSGYKSATVTGVATGVTAGAVARLYASTFPFKHAAAPGHTAALGVTNGSARFSFTVAPTLETRYQVEIFASRSSVSPEATSPSQVLYVAEYGVASSGENCGTGQCTIHINFTEVIQPSAITTEKSKHQYLYLSLPAAPGGVKPKPTTFHLVSGTVSAPTVRGEHVSFKISITYAEPPLKYWWYWLSCTRDTVTKDGVGLPGHHSCGNATVPPNARYLG